MHAETRSTRRIALFSANSASPRAKLVDAKPKAWHDVGGSVASDGNRTPVALGLA
jgi:hypothetical protein